MFKYLLLIGTTATISYFTWRKYNEANVLPPPPVTTPKETPREMTKEQTLKNADLHKAFAKILDKDKANKKRPRRTIDELIEENLKTGSSEMTGEERKLVIEKLKIDIEKLGKEYAYTDSLVDRNAIELKIAQKREQLENFEYIETQPLE